MKKVFILSPYISVYIFIYLLRNAFLALFTYNALLFLSFLIYRKSLRLKEILYIRSKPLTMVIVAISMSAGIILYKIWPFIERGNLPLYSNLELYGLSVKVLPFFILYFSLIHPVIEELYWRDILKSDSSLISYSELFFAGYHIMVLLKFTNLWFSIISFFGLIFISRLWRLLNKILDEKLTVILSHIAADFGIITAIYFLSNS